MREIGAPARRILASAAAGLLLAAGAACVEKTAPREVQVSPDPKPATKNEETETKPLPSGAAPAGAEVATLGAGCFWCVEAVYQQIPGVLKVESGYMGGKQPNPSYEDVCAGTTGHAEVVQVTFDPARLSYPKLLESFWKLHDPTTLNRQGHDVGTQYRSAIFFHSEALREAAEKSKSEAAKLFPSPIVTEITRAGPFYQAEDYHQNYYRLNKRQPYCQFVIRPKLEKLGLEK
jgi:peptide-methionine (S)-S-oxide reductase